MEGTLGQILIFLAVAVLYAVAEYLPALLKWVAERVKKKQEEQAAERAQLEAREEQRSHLPGGLRGGKNEPIPGAEAGTGAGGFGSQTDSPYYARQQELKAELARLESEVRNEGRGLLVSLTNQALGRAVEERLGGQLSALSRELDQLDLNEAPAVVLDSMARNIGAVKEALRVAKSVADQRRSGALNLPLADADALARAFLEPLHDWDDRIGLVQLPAREPVSVVSGTLTEAGATAVGEGLNTAALAGLGVATVTLPPTFPDQLSGWVAVPFATAQSMFHSIPGLRWEVMNRFGLPESQPIGFGYPGYLTQDQVLGPFGPWLPCLFGDVIGTAILGPSYTLALIDAVSDHQEPVNVVVAPTDSSGGLYGAIPPAHLRVLASCSALNELGFAEPAGRHWQAWNQAHGTPERIVIPMRLEGWTDVAMTQFAGVTQNITHLLVSEPFDSLADYRLQGIPRLLFSADDQQVAEQAAQGLVAGDTLSVTDPRHGLAAVVIASRENPSRQSHYLRTLRRLITPRSARSSREQVRRRVSAQGAEATGGAAATARLLRDAIVFGAVLERKGVGGGQRGRRGRPGR